MYYKNEDILGYSVVVGGNSRDYCEDCAKKEGVEITGDTTVYTEEDGEEGVAFCDICKVKIVG